MTDYAWEISIEKSENLIENLTCTGVHINPKLAKVRRRRGAKKTEFIFEADIPDEVLEHFGLEYVNGVMQHTKKFTWTLISYLGERR